MERKFDPERVRQLKDEAKQDLAIAGPELAALAVQAGLVDEFQLIVCPVIVGGGKRFFPDGVRFDLTLIEERLLGDGVVLLRYAVGN
jgi:dihydrofolate reductase